MMLAGGSSPGQQNDKKTKFARLFNAEDLNFLQEVKRPRGRMGAGLCCGGKGTGTRRFL